MTRRDTKIRCIRDKTSYEPMPYGKFAGQPTVSVKLSSSDTNSIDVTSLERLFRQYNWKRKLASGYARLRIYGDSPFADYHSDSLDFLFDTLDARFIDIEVEDKYIDTEPGTYIQRKTDTYTFFIDATKNETRYDPETLEYISKNLADHGNAQYIFKVDSVSHENAIKRFRRDYNIYDSDIWLFPKGRKRSSIEENRDAIETIAKRNTWNVSPRMDSTFDVDGLRES